MNPCPACVELKGKSHRNHGHKDLELIDSRDWPSSAINGSHTDRTYKCKVCGTGMFWTNDKMVSRTWS